MSLSTPPPKGTLTDNLTAELIWGDIPLEIPHWGFLPFPHFSPPSLPPLLPASFSAHCGTTDPFLSCFSRSSFWFYCSQEIVSTLEADRRARTRVFYGSLCLEPGMVEQSPGHIRASGHACPMHLACQGLCSLGLSSWNYFWGNAGAVGFLIWFASGKTQTQALPAPSKQDGL